MEATTCDVAQDYVRAPLEKGTCAEVHSSLIVGMPSPSINPPRLIPPLQPAPNLEWTLTQSISTLVAEPGPTSRHKPPRQAGYHPRHHTGDKRRSSKPLRPSLVDCTGSDPVHAIQERQQASPTKGGRTQGPPDKDPGRGRHTHVQLPPLGRSHTTVPSNKGTRTDSPRV